MKNKDLKKIYLLIGVNALILSLMYIFYSIYIFKNNGLVFTSSIIFIITLLSLINIRLNKHIISIINICLTITLILFNMFNNLGIINFG
jgi:hypothetical protein